jgi:hypothetical protein
MHPKVPHGVPAPHRESFPQVSKLPLTQRVWPGRHTPQEAVFPFCTHANAPQSVTVPLQSEFVPQAWTSPFEQRVFPGVQTAQ